MMMLFCKFADSTYHISECSFLILCCVNIIMFIYNIYAVKTTFTCVYYISVLPQDFTFNKSLFIPPSLLLLLRILS